jgi:flagellar basal-body rod protein FlgG
MLSAIVHQDTIASNLANVNTVGYKGDRVINETFSDTLMHAMKYGGQVVGDMNMGTRVAGVVTDFSQGSFRNTGNQLDCAIGGDGFFIVQNADNTVSYTRNGEFAKNAEGYLTTQRGEFVLGMNGKPIFVGQGDPSITADGRVFINGSQLVGQLGIATLDMDDAVKIGDNKWQVFADNDGDGSTTTLGLPPDTQIKQGFVEAANVNSIKEMIEMITTLRAYESSQRVVTAIDGTLDKAVNSVGTLR